ncbi:hypothetical protein ACFE04_024859 [Oxalis oulophora]
MNVAECVIAAFLMMAVSQPSLGVRLNQSSCPLCFLCACNALNDWELQCYDIEDAAKWRDILQADFSLMSPRHSYGFGLIKDVSPEDGRCVYMSRDSWNMVEWMCTPGQICCLINEFLNHLFPS